MLRSRLVRLVWIILVGSIFIVGMGGLAQYECKIEVIPPNPSTQDPIIFRLSGTWPNSCVPNSAQVSIVGNNIFITIFTPSGPCLQVLTPWTLDVGPIGPLPAGAYLVTVSYPAAPGTVPIICRTSFVVTPVFQVGPLPLPPVQYPAAYDEIMYLMRAKIEEAIKAYQNILGKTKINVANAAWWGSGASMIVVAPAEEIVVQHGAIIGLMGIAGIEQIPVKGFCAMRLMADKLPYEPATIALVDMRDVIVARLEVKDPPELAKRLGQKISSPRVDITTSWEVKKRYVDIDILEFLRFRIDP